MCNDLLLAKLNTVQIFIMSAFCFASLFLNACSVGDDNTSDDSGMKDSAGGDVNLFSPDSDIDVTNKYSETDKNAESHIDSSVVVADSGIDIENKNNETDKDVESDIGSSAMVTDSGIDTVNRYSDVDSSEAESDIESVNSICSGILVNGRYTMYPGPCTETRFSEPEGTVRDIVRYKYDSRGALLEIKSDSCDDSKIGCLHFVYTVDDNCRVVSMDDYSIYSGMSNACRTYTYDDAGRIKTTSTDVGCRGEQITRLTNSYDEDGNLVKIQNDEGHIVTTCTYDSHNNVLEESIHSSKGYPPVTTTHVYKYDERGNMIEEESFFPVLSSSGNMLGTRHIYTYDDAGNKTRDEEHRDSDDIPEMTTTYEYDNHGNLLVKETFGEVVADGRTVYTYDCFSVL